MIIGIDPGLERSAVVELKGQVVGNVFWRNNEDVLDYIQLAGGSKENELAIEMIQSYGMPVGKDVLDTCRWIGKFEERWNVVSGREAHLICRKSNCGLFPGVSSHLCHSNKANDSTIRQAVIDRFQRTGGGSVPQIGTKTDRGPLYHVARGIKQASKHTWQALAIAVVAQETLVELEKIGKVE